MEAHVVEGAVIEAALVLLHLGLDPADAPAPTLLAPVAVLAPAHAGALQRGVAAAAELDVVDGRVIAEQALTRLHADLEGGEVARGAEDGVGPLAKAARTRARARRASAGGNVTATRLRPPKC